MRPRCGHLVLLGLLLSGCQRGDGTAGAANETTPAPPTRVAALGRLGPKDGIIRLAGPSRGSPVIAKLLIEKGDRVQAGQPLAVLDSITEDEARVARTRAELHNAEADLGRTLELFRSGVEAVTLRDAAQLKVDVARAEQQAAQAALDGDTVRAPIAGQVIAIHARAGERVGPDGIAELAQTDRMYAIAEVYETDIGRVKVGQRATVRSPAFDPPLGGTVERIGLKVGRLDLLDEDPAARTDARIVEVEIRLDDSARSAALSNLQVDVEIEP
jgi:HlyD family secretion protein